MKTSSAFSFAQADIDHVLRLGGNTDRQRERIVAAFEKQKPTAEIADYLKSLFHGGNGIGSVTAWYGEDGIHLSHGKSARYDKSAQMNAPFLQKSYGICITISARKPENPGILPACRAYLEAGFRKKPNGSVPS